MSSATIRNESDAADEKSETEPEGAAPPAEERPELDVLLVDADESVLKSCRSILEGEGYDCDTASEAKEAVRQLQRNRYDMVLLDQDLPGFDALEYLREHREDHQGSLMVLTSESPSAETSMRAMEAGAWDFFPKPFGGGQLVALAGQAAYTVQRTRCIAEGPDADGILLRNGVTIIGVSSVFRRAVQRAVRAAATDAAVLLTGESGTGKELVARLIHEKSTRSRKNFVPVNCAALPSELLESEMFGHRRGAFTGAVREKPGLLETADGGTLFLDELTEMPLELQAKLLRVIQDGAVRRVGSEEVDSVVDVRFVSATNRDPEQAMEDGLLREDLYYRIKTVPVRMPPLRERPEDIPVLTRFFLSRWWQRYRGADGPLPELTPDALDALVDYHWPGNVRELENTIEQLVIFLDPGESITPGRLPVTGDDPEVDAETNGDRPPRSVRRKAPFDFRRPYHEAKDEMVEWFEREYLTRSVARAEGNLSEAARQAEVDRTTLYRLMEKHDLSRDALTG